MTKHRKLTLLMKIDFDERGIANLGQILRKRLDKKNQNVSRNVKRDLHGLDAIADICDCT